MSTHTISGVTFAWVLGCIGLAALFGVAYGTRRREPEHLVFALMALAMAAHAWSMDATFGGDPSTQTWDIGARIGFVSTAVTVTLFAHYALLFGSTRRKERITTVLYALLLAFLVIGVASEPFNIPVIVSVQSHALGFSVALTKPAWSAPVAIAAFAIPITAWAAVTLLGRAYLREKRLDRLAAFLGAIVLALSVSRDFGILLGVLRGAWLIPLGFFVFTFGVSSSLIVRHAVLGKELEHRTRELERSYAHLRATQAELVRKQQLAAVGELAAVIAHEVRNPLAIIMNATTGLHRRDLCETDERMLLDILDEEARRLNRLVSDLLRYARPIQLHWQPVDVRNVIGRAVHGLHTPHEIEVRIHEARDDDPVVSGDPDLLRLVFGNLVDNAAQAMSDGGTLTVRMRREVRASVDGVVIAIADTGHGMDPEVQKRATDPFFTTRPSGTGLGLAIVDRIIEAHGGTLAIESQPYQGTVVEVFLPIESGLDEADAIDGRAPISTPVPMPEAR